MSAGGPLPNGTVTFLSPTSRVRHGPAGGAVYVFFGRRVRDAIPPEVVERARNEGKALAQDQALDFALEGLRSSNP